MNDRAERLLAYAVILLGWGVRLFWLVESPIWYDESFTLFHAQEGPWHAMLTLGRMDNALPLHRPAGRRLPGLLTAYRPV